MTGGATRRWSRRQRRMFQAYACAVPAVAAMKAVLTRGSLATALTWSALVAAWLLIGPTRMEVRADARGVTVRNLLRTRRVPWELVRGFTFEDRFPWVARLELTTGADLPIWALSDEPWLCRAGRRPPTAEAVDALNRVFRQVLVGPPTTEQA